MSEGKKMIESRQIRQRASKLYYDLKRRSAPRIWKSGRRAGMVKTAGIIVPFTSKEFADWLTKTVGLNALPCPYCRTPIDVLSMELDHNVPLARGGDNSFGNLTLACGTCNRTKGKLDGKEFILLRRSLSQLSPAGEADVLQRLRSGAMGMRLSQQMRASKSKASGTKERVDDSF